MSGDSEEGTLLLRKNLDDAKHYLGAFRWCRRIQEAYFGMGVGGVVAVFLFHIDPAPDADEWLWVIVGDVPSAYLVTDNIKSPDAALDVYCDLMMGWVEAVETHGDLSEVFPVDAPATVNNAAALRSRVRQLREILELT